MSAMFKHPIRFFFDPISPFAYLAYTALASVKAANPGLAVSAHPVLFAGLLNATGQLGPAEVPAKVRSGIVWGDLL